MGTSEPVYSKAGVLARIDESAMCSFKSFPTMSVWPEFSTIKAELSCPPSIVNVSIRSDMFSKSDNSTLGISLRLLAVN